MASRLPWSRSPAERESITKAIVERGNIEELVELMVNSPFQQATSTLVVRAGNRSVAHLQQRLPVAGEPSSILDVLLAIGTQEALLAVDGFVGSAFATSEPPPLHEQAARLFDRMKAIFLENGVHAPEPAALAYYASTCVSIGIEHVSIGIEHLRAQPKRSRMRGRVWNLILRDAFGRDSARDLPEWAANFAQDPELRFIDRALSAGDAILPEMACLFQLLRRVGATSTATLVGSWELYRSGGASSAAQMLHHLFFRAPGELSTRRRREGFDHLFVAVAGTCSLHETRLPDSLSDAIRDAMQVATEECAHCDWEKVVGLTHLEAPAR